MKPETLNQLADLGAAITEAGRSLWIAAPNGPTIIFFEPTGNWHELGIGGQKGHGERRLVEHLRGRVDG